MTLDLLFALYAVVLGLIVGSYLNVVIYRLPRGLSTVLPRSRCPSCGEPIGAVDNVPVISYLVLGGRCRHCRFPIPWRYPVVEATAALLFLACYLRFGARPEALVAALFAATMVALAAIDAEHYILPDKITLPGIAAGLLLQPFAPHGSLPAAVLGAALGAGILATLAGGWYLLRREEGMGLGDVKMLAMVGAFLGWKGVLVTLFFASAAGALVGIAIIALGRGGGKTRLPFGTFLAAAALVALFWGHEIADAYLRLL